MDSVNVLEEIKNLDEETFAYKDYLHFYRSMVDYIKRAQIKTYSYEEFEIPKNEKVEQGAFGQVKKCRRIEDGKMYAVKFLNDINIKIKKQEYNYAKNVTKMIMSELISISGLNHEGVLKLSGVIVENNQDEKYPKLAMVFDYISGKDLKKYIDEKINENLLGSEEYNKKMLDFAIKLCEILVYIHSKNVIHRDIKPENIMITEGEERPILIDFGSAKITEAIVDLTVSEKGTSWYSPPENYNEILHGEDEEDVRFEVSSKFDVWSFACVVHEMFTGKRPWINVEDKKLVIELLDMNKEFPIDENFAKSHEELKELLLRCFRKKVEERFESSELLDELTKL